MKFIRRKIENGFTLTEILVVIAIIAIVGTILVLIFTNTLRGSNKSQMLAVIKQNGQAVLEDMDKTFRGSDAVICPFLTPPDTIIQSANVVVSKNGVYTRYRFIDSTPTTNGLIEKDHPVKQIILGQKETESDFINRVCNINDLMTDEVILTDTNLQTGVSVENGLFTRDQFAGSTDQVTIQFDLVPGVGISQEVAGQIDPVTFQTTVQLR